MGAEKTSKSGRKYRNDPLSPNGIQFEDDFDTSLYDDAFLGTDYEDLYKATLQQYQYEPQRAFLGNLTGKNQENAYNHDQARSAALNALLDQKRQDEYNDPMSQVARDKAAGLNPDLQGLSGEGQTEDAATSEPNKAALPTDIVPHILSFVSMVGSGIQGIQQLDMNAAVQEGMDLDNYAKAKNIVLGTLKNFNPHDPKNYYNGTYLQPEFNNSGTSRRTSSRLDKVYNQFWGSVEHEIAWRKQHGDKAAERQRLFNIESSAGYSHNDITMRKTATFIADQMINIQKLQMDASFHGSKGEKARQKVWSDTISSERGFMKWLRQRADKGDVVATRLLLSMIGSPNMQDNRSLLGDIGNVAKFAVTKRF